jgi:cytochrome c oxidase subunit IV
MDDRRRFWRLSRRPLLTWAALCILLAATCTLAYVPLGRGNLPLSLCIAAVKAALIGVIFMRLSEPNPINRFAASAGLLWIFILFVLLGSDYPTR